MMAMQQRLGSSHHMDSKVCSFSMQQPLAAHTVLHPVCQPGALRKKTVVCQSHNADEKGPQASWAAQQLLRQVVPPIGGERGQGFVQLKPNGDVTHLDVDRLNDQLRFTGAARLRNVQAPDQAYALVFQFDHLVTDTRGALAAAWKSLAAAHNLPCPHDTRRLLMHQTCPERIIIDVLGWCRDMKQARELSWELGQHFSQALAEGAEPAPGLRTWLELAASYHMPCAAVSSLDRATCRRVLERLHLHDHFSVLVTAEDECENLAQSLLTTAMRLNRPPNHMVLFDSCSQGVTAAHNVSMKAVAIASPHAPAWKMRAADVTVSSLSQLTVYNVRRLFANVGSEIGDLCKQIEQPPSNNKRRITNATL